MLALFTRKSLYLHLGIFQIKGFWNIQRFCNPFKWKSMEIEKFRTGFSLINKIWGIKWEMLTNPFPPSLEGDSSSWAGKIPPNILAKGQTVSFGSRYAFFSDVMTLWLLGDACFSSTSSSFSDVMILKALLVGVSYMNSDSPLWSILGKE